MTVLNKAPQTEILARTDIYFCHGGAGSTYEGIYLQVPLIMVPQFNDQYTNASVIEQFGIGIILDQSEVGKDETKFQTSVKNTLDALMYDWKSYRKQAVDLSNDIKESDDYDSGIEKIEKFVANNELIPKPLPTKNDGNHIWLYMG